MTDFNFSAFFEAHKRYQGARDAAFHATWDAWSPIAGPDLRIWPIDESALSFNEKIWLGPENRQHADGMFPWRDIMGQIWTTPRRFDVAIWKGQFLCALASGMASRGEQNVTIKFIERWGYEQNPLAGIVGPIAIEAAENYAKVLGKQMVKLKNPVPGVVRHYEKLGFSLAQSVKGNTYYGRSVK